LERLGIFYVPSVTNFILIKVPQKGQVVFEAMLKKGVIIRSMRSYALEDFIRVNVGLPEENERFLQALKEVIEKKETYVQIQNHHHH
jgi:histidinol-phosphate aminotransferase